VTPLGLQAERKNRRLVVSLPTRGIAATSPTTGLAGRQAKARVVIRAVILLVVGTALAMTNFGGGVINFYAVYFLLALPCCGPGPSRPSRSRSRPLRGHRAPQVAYCLRALLSESIVNTIDSYDPIRAPLLRGRARLPAHRLLPGRSPG